MREIQGAAGGWTRPSTSNVVDRCSDLLSKYSATRKCSAGNGAQAGIALVESDERPRYLVLFILAAHLGTSKNRGNLVTLTNTQEENEMKWMRNETA